MTREPHNPAKVISALERERDSLAARVRELEAQVASEQRAFDKMQAMWASLLARAQEVRRAWDRHSADDFPSGPVYRDIVAAIDALCPPSDTQADASRAPGAGEETR